jgi:hypothetical protein
MTSAGVEQTYIRTRDARTSSRNRAKNTGVTAFRPSQVRSRLEEVCLCSEHSCHGGPSRHRQWTRRCADIEGLKTTKQSNTKSDTDS